MFDVIVDAKITDMRESAKMGNFDSMVWLAIYINHGFRTPKNPDLALSIFNYVIANKEKIPFKESYWEALCQKTQIHRERDEEEIIDQLALELIRHMAQFDPKEWEYGRMESAVRWLKERQYNEASSLV